MSTARLGKKINVLLLLVFFVGIILIGSSLSIAMDYQVAGQAQLLIQTMNSVRNYTSERINPLLKDNISEAPYFIPETVPAFAAREVFEHFSENPEFQNYSYKEATLNPTNVRDQADAFETALVNQFRRESTRQELSGYRLLNGARLYYLSRPLSVTKPSCLECHSRPERAPKSQIATYGTQQGFGWKLHEIVAAQTVYVPANTVLRLGLKNLFVTIEVMIGLFVVMMLAINVFLRRSVVDPIQKLTAIAQELSQGTPTLEQLQAFQGGSLKRMTHSQDEPGQLLQAFRRMAQGIFQREQHLLLINQALQTSEANERSRAQTLESSLQELRQTQAALVQSEKMSSLGQLVAGIAHEINNPINFVHANLEFVNRYASDLLSLIKLYQSHYPQPFQAIQDHQYDIDIEFLQTDLVKILSSMQMGTDRIREIILGLRNFSRLDEAEFKTVDLHEGIDSTLMILQARLKGRTSDIRVIRDYGDLPRVNCYPGPLNQVMMNLLTNAIDALEQAPRPQPSSTRVDSGSTEHHTQHPLPTIHIQTTEMDDFVQIKISDNGVGIPIAVQARLFDPFFTTKPVGKGTGLGLSISYQIITEKHGGTLRCISTVGIGTTFVIEIPIRQSLA
jgi:signal transduction histidine kinase